MRHRLKEILPSLGITQKELANKIGMTEVGMSNLINKWKSHTNLTHPGKYFRPSKVKIMRPTSPK